MSLLNLLIFRYNLTYDFEVEEPKFLSILKNCTANEENLECIFNKKGISFYYSSRHDRLTGQFPFLDTTVNIDKTEDINKIKLILKIRISSILLLLYGAGTLLILLGPFISKSYHFSYFLFLLPLGVYFMFLLGFLYKAKSFVSDFEYIIDNINDEIKKYYKP
jgi:hypothetical protein